MNVKDYAWAKREINIFLIKGGLIYGIALFILIIISKIFGINSLWFPVGFLFLYTFCFIIWGSINGYIYFIKKKGRSPLKVSWEEMVDFEKEYFIRVRKIGWLNFILLGETIFFIILYGIFIL